MAHFQQLQFVAMLARHMTDRWSGRRVVEIGAADVNGTIRPFFPGAHYTGVDLAAGPGVDLVASGHEVPLDDHIADLAISCECFEHNPQWLETFVDMHRMTRPGGVVVVTCASRGRLEHGTTRSTPHESPGTTSVGWNYYRNLNRGDFARRLDLDAMFESHAFFRNDVSRDLYFAGRKRGAAERPLRLDLPVIYAELEAVNTLITAEQPQRVRDRLRRVKELPLKWAAHLPDPVYQSFVRRWTGAERAIRRALRGK